MSLFASSLSPIRVGAASAVTDMPAGDRPPASPLSVPPETAADASGSAAFSGRGHKPRICSLTEASTMHFRPSVVMFSHAGVRQCVQFLRIFQPSLLLAG
jgi:hypothetical protein